MLARYWINQPSTLQPDHALHGKNVLADITDAGPIVTAYFTTGAVVAALVFTKSLAPGWKPAVNEAGSNRKNSRLVEEHDEVMRAIGQPNEGDDEEHDEIMREIIAD